MAATRANLVFKPFDERGDVRIYYHGFLPHWRQIGCTYFVTWRLADSIPQAVLMQWRSERAEWLQARGIDSDASHWLQKFKQLPYSERILFERHFVSQFLSKLDEGLGECVLRQQQSAREAFRSVVHFHGQRLDVGDVVVMPNHVHALLTPYDGFPLENLLHSIKSFSSNQIQRLRKTSGTLWMKESHDHIVRDGEELQRIQRYIRANPDKANLPRDEYLLSTAEYNLKDHRG
ncbi:MAG: transposase [Rubripirellula sp.]